mgnify:FL=1
MKKRMLSLFMAAMSVAMFGILYPEYILLPDTYEYIAEKSPKQVCETCHGELTMEDLTELLYETPENIRVSSKVLQMLEEEGIVRWKNRN